MILNTFLYYLCFASAVLVYGIGSTRLVEFSSINKKEVFFFVKLILTVSVTVILCWLVNSKILARIGMVELYPFICFFIYASVSSVTEAVFRIVTDTDSSEFIVSFLIVLVSVSEGANFLDTLVISGSCVASLLCLLPLVYSFRDRINHEGTSKEKYYTRLFLFLSLLIIILSAWDSVWFNPEVIK